MVKKCIYCSTEIDSGSVVDMCHNCMYQVWGEKMAKAIVESMEKEKIAGNLELGRVSEHKVGTLNKEIKREMKIVDFDNSPSSVNTSSDLQMEKFISSK